LNIIIYGLTAPVAGALVDRWKPRRVAFIGIVILAAAAGLCYFATQLWHFYLFFGILAPIGTAFAGTPILNPTLINWFGKRRGMAISLGQIGGGLSFAYGLIVEAVIASWGWRPAFIITGLRIKVWSHTDPKMKKFCQREADRRYLPPRTGRSGPPRRLTSYGSWCCPSSATGGSATTWSSRTR
jgi:MFS family permease